MIVDICEGCSGSGTSGPDQLCHTCGGYGGVLMAPLRSEVEAANDAWGFNCGPAVLCAVTGLSPDAVRQHFGTEWKGYTTPTWMEGAIRSAGLRIVRRQRWTESVDHLGGQVVHPLDPQRLGLFVTRVQWDGPWCSPAVPPAAGYRYTHWIAEAWIPGGGWKVYDVNLTFVGGWVERNIWADRLVPMLTRDIKRATGRWWRTHVWEVGNG